MSDQIEAALQSIFSADSGIYQTRGFQRRVGFGRRPALIHVDLADAWTRRVTRHCDGIDVIIPAVQRLDEPGARRGSPSSSSTTAYAVTSGPHRHGTVAPRIPVGCQLGARGHDRPAHRPARRRAGDRRRARERLPRHLPIELPQRQRGRHGDHHRGDDGRRPPHHRGRDRRGLPSDRRARSRRRPRAGRGRVEPVRHRLQVRRRRAARAGARLSRRARSGAAGRARVAGLGLLMVVRRRGQPSTPHHCIASSANVRVAHITSSITTNSSSAWATARLPGP